MSDRKRPNVSTKSLLDLKSIITQNVTLNNNTEKSSQQNDDFDKIENKKRKISQTFPNRNVLVEYLTKPDLKQSSNQRIITLKEDSEQQILEQSNIQSPSKRIVIPRTSNEEDVTRVHPIISSRDEFKSSTINSDQTHDFSHFESVLDCCDSSQREESINTSDYYWDSFHTSALLRETMINISKRLTKIKSLSIVDTHCHFDLIFDRLYIKHNNVKKYFDDYKDFYPSGLSFELAIHVFWRPQHLIEKNWINWYSNYLNDERVYGSCGIHPHWSSSWTERSIDDIERCLKHPKIVAIGEIGLDFGPKNTCNPNQQCRVFEEQLKLAVKWFKPIVIHSRDAYQQTFEIMKQNLQPDHKIHLHCFVGTIDDVHLFTSYFNQIKFGFTPMISRGNFLHTVIQQLDLTQILSETDSPYFVPEELSHLSRCAHPGMVYSVIEIIAQIRQLSLDEVACQLRVNASHIYGV